MTRTCRPGSSATLQTYSPNSVHVAALGLGSTPDPTLWEFAGEHGFVFLTKDKDYANFSLAWGAPPKVILLQTGNCSTDRLLGLIRRNAIRLADFESDVKRSLLVLR